MALLFVLWLMTILCVVAVEMRYASHLHMQVTANLGEETKALFYARAGVERAIADLVFEKNATAPPLELRDADEEVDYKDVPIDEGTYTLFAGMDEDGRYRYGLRDEGAKINVNKADAAVLAKLPGVGDSLAADIVALRQHTPLTDLGDLLKLENVTVATIYGEDQNRNGALDANEDDGDQSWPPDNHDGKLDAGLSAYLTVWSSIREVSLDNKARVKLNKAGAEEITKGVKDISQQQAEAIVAARDKKKFTSVADLLDVELVEKVDQQGQPNKQTKNPSDPRRPEQEKPDPKKPDQNSPDPNKPNPNNRNPNQNQNQNQNKQPTTRTTGVKAFDNAGLKKIADSVTVSEEDLTQGLVNINTASVEVLECLPGIDDSMAYEIVNERQGQRDHYKSIADLLDIKGMTSDLFKGMCASLTTRADVFEARSYGVLPSQTAFRCVSAILDRTQDEVHIRAWKELE